MNDNGPSNSENKNSNSNKSSNNKRRNNRNRNFNKKRSEENLNIKTKEGSDPKKRPNNRNRNRNRNRNIKPGPPLPLNERIYKKYDHLIEVLGHARKKYFELFFRADPRQKKKLLDNYTRGLEAANKFENSLEENELQIFKTRYKKQELDLTYTTNHEINPVGDQVNNSNQFPDPHYLVTQQEADFKQDNEESSGSMDDYNSYKEL
jgi:hypothetical protein